MMSEYGYNYYKLLLIRELLVTARRITRAGYHIRFVPGTYQYWDGDVNG